MTALLAILYTLALVIGLGVICIGPCLIGYAIILLMTDYYTEKSKEMVNRK